MNTVQENVIKPLEEKLAQATRLCDAFIFAMSGSPIGGLGAFFIDQETGKISRGKAIENLFKEEDGSPTILEGDVEKSDLLTIFPELLERCQFYELSSNDEVQPIPGELHLLEDEFLDDLMDDEEEEEEEAQEEDLTPIQQVLHWLSSKRNEKKTLSVEKKTITIERKDHTRIIHLPQRNIKIYGMKVSETDYMIVLHDETPLEQKNKQLQTTLEQLKRTQTQLVQSEKMAALGELVAGVAHEINTPISIGSTASTYLLERDDVLPRSVVPDGKEKEIESDELAGILYKLQKDRGDYFYETLSEYLISVWQSANMIFVNMNRASKLIRSFKTLSTDQFVEDLQGFSVRKYLNDVIMIGLKPALKNTNLTINITFENDRDILLESYPGAFGQVLINMIMNSKSHAFDGNEAGEISLSFRKDKKFLYLLFKDNGKGMEPSILAKIFDPFFTTKRGSGGTGLGLSITYNIVTQQLRGSIKCESEVGKFTSFDVKIPLKVMDAID